MGTKLSRLFHADIYTIRIGKKGITEALLKEIDRALDAHGAVKVKMLKNYRESRDVDRREVARLVAERVNAKLVGVRGFTFILVRERGRKS